MRAQPLQLCGAIVCATVFIAVAEMPLPAKPKAAASSQLCVDVVKLKSGKTMRGAIVHSDADGSLTMAVSRDWLQRAHPDVFKKLAGDEGPLQRKAWEQLRDRLKKELEKPDQPQLTVRFKTELERVENLLAHPEAVETPQFIWLDVSNNTIAKMTRPPEERQRTAIWAWSERLANIETRDADDLSRELKKQGIDPSVNPPDLSERFPPRLQDEREWSARLAIATYAAGEPLDFQGTGEMLVESNGARDEKDMAPIMAKLMSQQVGSLLTELLGEEHTGTGKAKDSNEWLKPAIRAAEQKKARAFRATRVDVNPNGRQTTVHSEFVARLENGDWTSIWSEHDAQDASKERSDIEARITNDPQVKSALDAVKSFGLANGEQFQQAIRFGTATMAAQQAVDTRFAVYRDSMLKRLDGPPLWLDEKRREKSKGKSEKFR